MRMESGLDPIFFLSMVVTPLDEAKLAKFSVPKPKCLWFHANSFRSAAATYVASCVISLFLEAVLKHDLTCSLTWCNKVLKPPSRWECIFSPISSGFHGSNFLYHSGMCGKQIDSDLNAIIWVALYWCSQKIFQRIWALGCITGFFWPVATAS